MYAINYDEAAGFLITTLNGLLTVEEGQRFMTELSQKADEIRRRNRRVLMLTDATGLNVQKAETVEALGRLGAIAKGVRVGDKAAIVLDSQLLKMQVRRIADERTKTFGSMDEARAWLKAPETVDPSAMVER